MGYTIFNNSLVGVGVGVGVGEGVTHCCSVFSVVEVNGRQKYSVCMVIMQQLTA